MGEVPHPFIIEHAFSIFIIINDFIIALVSCWYHAQGSNHDSYNISKRLQPAKKSTLWLRFDQDVTPLLSKVLNLFLVDDDIIIIIIMILISSHTFCLSHSYAQYVIILQLATPNDIKKHHQSVTTQ